MSGKRTQKPDTNVRVTMKKLFILLLVLTETRAQPFTYQAEVGPVSLAGYHRIVLSPAIVGKLQSNLTDVRLYDVQQREVPYLLDRQLPVQQRVFRPLALVRSQMTPRGATTLVLHNRARRRISSLGLIIKNTQVIKTATLSGSTDAKTWYGIEDNIVLEPVPGKTGTSEVKILDFPLSDYEFYQLIVNDSLSAPLNIVQMGYYELTTTRQGKYIPIPGTTFTQRDSLRQSIIRLAFVETARIDRLLIQVQSPAQYHRRVTVNRLKTRRSRRGRWLQYYEPLRVFYLSSTGEQRISLADLGLKANELYLFIDNEDSPPLQLKAIQAEQAEVALIADLAANQPYQLRYGHARVSAPAYDLVYFKQTIPAKLPIAQVKVVTNTRAKQAESAVSLFQNPWIIWPALGLVLGLLFFMSYRMLGEMGKG